MKAARFLSTDFGQLLAFTCGAAFCVVVSIAASAAVGGLLGIAAQVAYMALASGIFCLLLLPLSAVIVRYQNTTLATIGLPTNAHRLREFCFGFLVSTLLFLAVAWAQSLAVGAAWKFQGTSAVLSALTGLVLATSMVLAEELVFRGIALRSIRQIVGDRPAIVLTALFFGTYHLVGSGDWGMGAVFRFVTPTLGGLLFGWVVIRSGGLALPIGLHLGGNWVQASLAGFQPMGQVAAPQTMTAVWQIPITNAQLETLSAPDLVPRLPYFGALVLIAMIMLRFSRADTRPIPRAG